MDTATCTCPISATAYVYTYAFGNIMSSTMIERYRQDKGYLEAIDTFLSLGESDNVHNIFKRIGLNTTDPETFHLGLKKIDENIKLLTRLTRKTGKAQPAMS